MLTAVAKDSAPGEDGVVRTLVPVGADRGAVAVAALLGRTTSRPPGGRTPSLEAPPPLPVPHGSCATWTTGSGSRATT
ncbi:hypothetical protein ACFXPY_18180 [Streptomyces sp. NPDC059153]|uniref:hypothetical protein n=1 Tax=unclassified Streptomyces TaxID=2593676 RepID=UPI003697DD15